MKNLMLKKELLSNNPAGKNRICNPKFPKADISRSSKNVEGTKMYYGRRPQYSLERLQFMVPNEKSYLLKRSKIMKDAIAVQLFWEQIPQIKIELANQFRFNRKWREYVCQLSLPFEICAIGMLQQILDAKSLIVLHRVHEMLHKQKVPIDVIYFCLFELFDKTKALSCFDDIMKNEQSLADYANRSTNEYLEIFKSHKN